MYAGDQSTTTRGIECQKWSEQTPHEHQRFPAQFPGKGSYWGLGCVALSWVRVMGCVAPLAGELI